MRHGIKKACGNYPGTSFIAIAIADCPKGVIGRALEAVAGSRRS